MVRTTWLRERRVEEFEDALGRLEGKRPSAMDADAAYSSRATRDKLARLGIADSVQCKGYRNHPSSAVNKRRNAGIAVVRLGVERTFAVYKRCYGLGRTRFVGLAKNLTFYGLAAIAHDIRKGARFPGLYGVAEPACGKQGASAQAAGGGTGAAPGIAPGPGHGTPASTVSASGPCMPSTAIPSDRAVLSALPSPLEASREACVLSAMRNEHKKNIWLRQWPSIAFSIQAKTGSRGLATMCDRR